MQTTGSPPTGQDRARKSGYGVTVVVNATLLVFVINLLDWELRPFLTEEFEAVVPWISLSLVLRSWPMVVMVGAGIRILAALGRLVSTADTIDDPSHPIRVGQDVLSPMTFSPSYRRDHGEPSG